MVGAPPPTPPPHSIVVQLSVLTRNLVWLAANDVLGTEEIPTSVAHTRELCARLLLAAVTDPQGMPNASLNAAEVVLGMEGGVQRLLSCPALSLLGPPVAVGDAAGATRTALATVLLHLFEPDDMLAGLRRLVEARRSFVVMCVGWPATLPPPLVSPPPSHTFGVRRLALCRAQRECPGDAV
jgi:hypothetical protein